MKSFKKGLFGTIALTMLLSLGMVGQSYASPTKKTEVNGFLSLQVEFKGQTMKDVKSLYEKGGVDPDELVQSGLLFLDSNNYPSLKTSLPNLSIKLDDKSVNLDSNNKFYIENLTAGNHKIRVFTDNNQLIEKDVKVVEGENDLKIEMNFGFNETLNAMDVHMSNMDMSNMDMSNMDMGNMDMSNMDMGNMDMSNMDMSNMDMGNMDMSNMDMSNMDMSNMDVGNMDMSNMNRVNEFKTNYYMNGTTVLSNTYSGGLIGSGIFDKLPGSSIMVDPDAYYQGHKVGGWFGTGKGRMKMLTSEGHVSCNKAYHDQGGNFPTNQSDCTVAVAMGALYMGSPAKFPQYRQGSYCVQESMTSVFNENLANVYCNGKAKSGGYYAGFKNKGYNCSSFTFMVKDERLTNF